MTDNALHIENLGKQYSIGNTSKDGTLRGSISQLGSIFSKRKKQKFWALEDINFSIEQGKSVGVIGHNGAGKSTLLKIISRITEPSTGSVTINGRVSSLLEVGTGFHPELTGGENVYLNGTILGMKRSEISSKFDEIVEFSGVERFINTPVKHYSSGMKVRLAFSVAAHLEPEILLIDEVLAVGDSEFQKRCLNKMESATSSGRTVLFVSHNLGAVRSLCDQTILLEKGRMEFMGDTAEAIDRYLEQGSATADLTGIVNRKGDGKVRFTRVEFINEEGSPAGTIHSGQNIIFRLHCKSDESLQDVIIRLQVVSMEGIILFTCNNFHTGDTLSVDESEAYVDCYIPHLPLNSGRYLLNLQCLINRTVVDEINYVSSFDVEPGDYYSTGKLPSVKQGVLVEHNWRSK